MLDVERDPASETGPQPSALGWLPARLGRYELRATIGRGMMGLVYEAWDPLLGRAVALKILRPDLPLSEHDRALMEQRFLREASLAATLSHPNIVVVHDFGRDPETNVPFIAFEFLEGRTLAEVAGPAPLEWREALGLIARLARALHHAHGHGTIHRDIKPANVMVLPSGEPKLLDFGIARASAVQLSAAGESWGTPSYMSPEQAMAGVVDGRSDLFSLGSVLYELLTGVRAFSGDDVVQVMARVLRDDPPPPTRAIAALPLGVDVVLARALAKHPSERYPDGQALAEDIEDVLDGRPVRARPGLRANERSRASRVPLRPSPGQRLRRWAPGVAIGTALIVGGMLTLGFSAPGGHGSQTSAVGPLLSKSSAASAMAVVNTRATPADAVVVAEPKAAPVVPLARQPARGSRTEPSIAPSSGPSLESSRAPSAAPELLGSRRVLRTAHVALSIEHAYESGQLRVWIDDKLVLDRALTGTETRKLLVLKRRKGSLVEVLELHPGERRLRFEVEADGARRSAELSAAFGSEETRLLQVKLGSKLQLKWKR